MHNISGNISILGAAMLMSVSCLSSIKSDDSRTSIGFAPVLGTEVRSGDVSPFPEDMDFGVWAETAENNILMDREYVSFDGSDWMPESSLLWPENVSVHFTGYAPYDLDADFRDDGSLVLEDYESVKDGRGFYLSDMTDWLEQRDGTVQLTFRPMTAKVDFRMANGLNMVTSVKVEKIILSGVHVQGSFDSSAFPQWTADGVAEDIVAYDCEKYPEDCDVGREQKFFGEPIVFVPQTSHPVVRVIYSYSVGDGWINGQQASTDVMNVNWEAGRKYTYSLTLTENTLEYTTGISAGQIE